MSCEDCSPHPTAADYASAAAGRANDRIERLERLVMALASGDQEEARKALREYQREQQAKPGMTIADVGQKLRSHYEKNLRSILEADSPIWGAFKLPRKR